jgi:hypothetical protein
MMMMGTDSLWPHQVEQANRLHAHLLKDDVKSM